ncbi:hypothetical protein Tco_1511820, partial [Tanacetum coccineum]
MALVQGRGHGGDNGPPNDDVPWHHPSVCKNEKADKKARDLTLKNKFADNHKKPLPIKFHIIDQETGFFDLVPWLKGPHGVLIEKGIKASFKGRWKDRKRNFKKHEFVLRDGYKEPIKIRDFPPTDVKIEEWRKIYDHFTSEKHLKRSRSSKVNRSKQLYSSNQGMESYAQSIYEEFNEETGEFPDLIDHFRTKHMKGANGTTQWPKRDT